MNKQEIFLRKQEAIVERGIFKILQQQERDLISILEREIKSYELKGIPEDILEYIENLKVQIPDYLLATLPAIMQKTYKQAFKPWKSYLQDYRASLRFDIETEPAARFLRARTDLHLSENQGSIYKTTKKEILTILAE